MSVIICVPLHGDIVNHSITFDKSLVRLSILSLDWRSIQIDLRVDDQKRIVGVEHIVVDTDTVEVLLQETLEEHILLLEGCLLLLDGKLVKKNLVVSLVEVVEELELVVHSSSHAFDSFDVHVWYFFLRNFVTLIEWEHLLFLGLKLSAELGGFKNLLS